MYRKNLEHGICWTEQVKMCILRLLGVYCEMKCRSFLYGILRML